MAKSKYSLYDVNTTAPEELEISGGMRNAAEIAKWWERVKLYARAMRSLDRVTMLCYDESDDKWYLASVEQRGSAS